MKDIKQTLNGSRRKQISLIEYEQVYSPITLSRLFVRHLQGELDPLQCFFQRHEPVDQAEGYY